MVINFLKKYFAVILLFLHCGLIFYFSAQPASESSSVSQGLLERIFGFLPVMKGISPELLGTAEHILRKSAHFVLYFMLGIYAILSSDVILKKKRILYSLLFCLIYAASDELHQLLSPGRSAEIRDVLIDFSGSAAGVFLIHLIKWRKRRALK